MTKTLFALAFLCVSTLGSSAFAASLKDVQTRLAPLIPDGRAVREMSGVTTYAGGATCMSSISIKPDEVEILATWGDTGMGLRLSPEDEIEVEQSETQLKLTVQREGLPTSATLTMKGNEVVSILLEETYRTLFFKRHASLLCEQQVTFLP